jgi:hypothetical protein
LNGFADGATTWVAAAATLVVLSRLLGSHRLFGVAQMLLAGLVTGYLVVLAIDDVVVPRLVQPLAADAARLDLWIGLLLVAATVGARWLPVSVARVPVVFLVAALAAFAVGGAVVGTLLPQLTAGIVAPAGPAAVAGGLLALAISVAVAIAFLHGGARGSALAITAGAGRWLLLAGIGGWLGYLLVTRLVLLVERIGFLLFDWLGFGA